MESAAKKAKTERSLAGATAKTNSMMADDEGEGGERIKNTRAPTRSDSANSTNTFDFASGSEAGSSDDDVGASGGAGGAVERAETLDFDEDGSDDAWEEELDNTDEDVADADGDSGGGGGGGGGGGAAARSDVGGGSAVLSERCGHLTRPPNCLSFVRQVE